jgi:hypothetical protein
MVRFALPCFIVAGFDPVEELAHCKPAARQVSGVRRVSTVHTKFFAKICSRSGASPHQTQRLTDDTAEPGPAA